jgi:hypothetical protein
MVCNMRLEASRPFMAPIVGEQFLPRAGDAGRDQVSEVGGISEESGAEPRQHQSDGEN